MISLPRLYAIADAAFGNPVVLARELFDGGARLVQVRNKNASARELFNQVVAILEFAPADSRVIVNDRADVALLSGAAESIWDKQICRRSVFERYFPQARFLDFQRTASSRLWRPNCCLWTTLPQAPCFQRRQKPMRIPSLA